MFELERRLNSDQYYSLGFLTGDVGGGAPVAEWLDYIQKHTAESTEDLQWQFLLLPRHARPGVCAAVCKSFATVAGALLQQAVGDQRLYAVVDVTYSVFSSQWGVARLALACKRYDAAGLVRTELNTLGIGFVPKESESALGGVLTEIMKWHESHGIGS